MRFAQAYLNSSRTCGVEGQIYDMIENGADPAYQLQPGIWIDECFPNGTMTQQVISFQKRSFLPLFCSYKTDYIMPMSISQDRLGTNLGKNTPKQDSVCAGLDGGRLVELLAGVGTPFFGVTFNSTLKTEYSPRQARGKHRKVEGERAFPVAGAG
jgi:hypothetical protein